MLVGVAVAYVLSAKLGFAMAFVGGNVSAVWIPSGLGVAALLVGGLRLWPALWAGAFLATADTGAPLLTAAGIASGNTLEYIVAAVVLRRLAGGVPTFRSVRQVVALAAVAAMAPAVSALLGTASLCLGGVAPWAIYWIIVKTWWLGDSAGMLLVTPLLVAWSQSRLPLHGQRMGELALLAALAAAASASIFGAQLWEADDHVFAYLMFPFLIWAALRHGIRGAATVVLAVNIPAIVFTAQGMGLFARPDQTQSLLLLQAFMTVAALTALVTAAALAERDAASDRARLLGHAVEQSATTVMITDPQGNLTFVNRAFVDLTGHRAEDVIGTNPRFLKTGHTHPDEYARLWETISSGRTWRGEFLNRTADGGVIWGLATISPVRDEDGRITHYIGTEEDITARKAGEARLRRALAKVERAKAELERVAYAVTHTLQEPLRGIGGFTQLIERRYGAQLDAEGRGYLQRVVESTHRMQRLFRDLMDYALIDQVQEVDTPVDLAAVVRAAVEACGGAGRVEVGPLPVVSGNATQLRHVMTHLIGNGLTYHPPGRLSRVTVTADRDTDMWKIVIADDGIGIADEYHDRLFNLFVRLHTEQEYPGSGVGLAYCRRVVERHGGAVGLESDPGLGTRVILWLPVPSTPEEIAA
ncbi:MASE1 domain-containing protein [Caenispirillum bisanense]|uniref:MASE1 domain-containing protein n=1 Tax=Caenispirillum bisanense TaxID=414052 RepID=UPI0031CDB347